MCLEFIQQQALFGSNKKKFPVHDEHQKNTKIQLTRHISQKVLGQSFYRVLLLSWIGGQRNSLLWLRADPLGVIKEALQGVDLSDSNSKHDKQVYAGPEGHPPQVILQKVAVPRLKGPQQSLDLAGPL